ncbi:MAG TPA: DUF4062 domain-containing protein, partial [Cyclobacteriaceae bacterium]|nr:DUF4062 domain-containing protein [Cyclobacteriaceae bacterium]
MLDKVIRVFISSTFKDMEEEHRILHSDCVNGRLRRLCESAGFQFQFIDLRWGISQEAGWDQRTEKLCLEEIDRCRDVSPRPNFLALVGQRYGWRPLPIELNESDWPLVLAEADQNRALVEEWYLPDWNNNPFVYRLRPRLSEEEQTAKIWCNIEAKLQGVILKCLEKYPDQVSNAIKLSKISLTEKEILRGGENTEQEGWQAFAYRRSVWQGNSGNPNLSFMDTDSSGQPDKESEGKINDLWCRLDCNEKIVTRSFQVKTDNEKLDPRYLELFGESVYVDLAGAIIKQLEVFDKRNALQREIEAHQDFAKRRLKNFVSRSTDEKRLLTYLSSPTEKTPLIIAAPSGGGKTALLAQAERLAKESMPESIVVTRFIGTSGDSSAIATLLRSIHLQVSGVTGSSILDAEFDKEPARMLGETLKQGSAEKPVLILLDALDQLSREDNGHLCGWLPSRLPKHSRLIVTMMSEEPDGNYSEIFKHLSKRLPKGSITFLDVMEDEDLQIMFERWLSCYKRTVTEEQKVLVARAIANCPRPLFVRLLAEITREWWVDDLPDTLPKGIQEAVATLLTELESNTRHGRTLVAEVLAKLSASRSGLTEAELVELLGRNKNILEDFRLRSRSRHEFEDKKFGLPPIIWSRLLIDLDLFLGQTSANGVSLLGFYHRQLEFAVNERYRTEIAAAAESLADFFEEQSPWLTGSTN